MTAKHKVNVQQSCVVNYLSVKRGALMAASSAINSSPIKDTARTGERPAADESEI